MTGVLLLLMYFYSGSESITSFYGVRMSGISKTQTLSELAILLCCPQICWLLQTSMIVRTTNFIWPSTFNPCRTFCKPRSARLFIRCCQSRELSLSFATTIHLLRRFLSHGCHHPCLWLSHLGPKWDRPMTFLSEGIFNDRPTTRRWTAKRHPPTPRGKPG